MAHVYRADTIGSLLRPQYLKLAREQDVPDDKTVVLGLVSSKSGQLEPPGQLAARISEAGGFFPLDQLALSTQCGFASAGPGNQISEADRPPCGWRAALAVVALPE